MLPEILPWVSRCYGSYPELWHPIGHLSSQSGVQQGDPLGLMLFVLVLQKLISTIDADDEWPGTYMMVCLQVNVLQSYVHCIILKNWDLIWGLFINVSKCEVFSPQGNHLFPPAVKSSNLETRGVPIGDYLYCSHFIVEKCFNMGVGTGPAGPAAAGPIFSKKNNN